MNPEPEELTSERRWMLSAVLWPFLVTRAVLLLVGRFSVYFQPAQDYYPPACGERWWQFSPCRWLDIWGRFDTSAYVRIVQGGYPVPPAGGPLPNEWALFPLYPLVMKLGTLLMLTSNPTAEQCLLAGVVISNLFLIGALILLYRLARAVLGTPEAAERTNWFLLLGPAGFFFSCAYSESMFLFFAVAALLAGLRGRWAVAGVMGALLAATRPLGVLVVVPLLLQYLRSVAWRWSAIRPSVLWLGIVPVGILAYFGYCHVAIGDFLAPVHVQSNWGRELAWPWETILFSGPASGQLLAVERLVVLSWLAVALASFFVLRSPGLGAFAILLILPPLCSGVLHSIVRYCAVVFPVFLVLAVWSHRYRVLDPAIRTAFLAIQITYFIAWCRFYWVA